MTKTAALRQVAARTWAAIKAEVPLVLLIVGAVVIVKGVAQWTRPGATVLAGVLIIAAGVLLLDVDVSGRTRNRSRRP